MAQENIMRVLLLTIASLLFHCAAVLSDGENQDPDSDKTPDDIEETEDPDFDCKGPFDAVTLTGAQKIDAIELLSSRCEIWALDSSQSKLYIVNLIDGSLRDTLSFSETPKDLIVFPNEKSVVVSLPGIQEVQEIQSDDLSVAAAVNVGVAAARMSFGTDRRIYYVEDTNASALYETNLASGESRTLSGNEFHFADLDSSPDGSILYVGESQKPGSVLRVFDTQQNNFPETRRFVFDGGFGLPSPKQRVLADPLGLRVYWSDRSFLGNNVKHMKGWVGDTVRAVRADRKVIAGERGIYDAETYLLIAAREYTGPAAFSVDGGTLFEFNPDTAQLIPKDLSTVVTEADLNQRRVNAGSLASRSFVQFLHDPIPERFTLYALDAKNNTLVFIDTRTLNPYRAEVVGSQPTDMAITPDGDRLVIATFGATELAVFDINDPNKGVSSRIVVTGNPYRVAVAANQRAAYAEQDQSNELTLVDLQAKSVLDTSTAMVEQPDVAFNPTGQFLFAGEAYGDGLRLRKFDISGDVLNEVAISTETFSAPIRHIAIASGSVFYAKSRISENDLSVEGSFSSDIVAVSPSGRFAAAADRLFDAEAAADGTNFNILTLLPTRSVLLAFSADNQILYQLDNATGGIFIIDLSVY